MSSLSSSVRRQVSDDVPLFVERSLPTEENSSSISNNDEKEGSLRVETNKIIPSLSPLSSEWRIYPPLPSTTTSTSTVSIDDDNKQQHDGVGNRINAPKRKRRRDRNGKQPQKYLTTFSTFPYQVGDRVLLMMTRVMMDRYNNNNNNNHGDLRDCDSTTPCGRSTAEGTSAAAVSLDRSSPSMQQQHASSSNNNNNNKRKIVVDGIVVRVDTTTSTRTSHDDAKTVRLLSSNGEQQQQQPPHRQHDRVPEGSRVGVVVAVQPVLSCMPQDDATRNNNVLALDEKEQQRFLQPNMTMTINIKTPTSKNNIAFVVVPETVPFRQVVQFQVSASLCSDGKNNRSHQKGHRVLEIGCSTGEMSQRIWSAATSEGDMAWVGIDTSSEMVQKCSQRLETYLSSCSSTPSSSSSSSLTYKVLKLDPLLEPNRSYQEITDAFGGSFPTVVCVDIGGNREIQPVMEVLEWVNRYFVTTKAGQQLSKDDDADPPPPPRLVIIKSRSLVRDIQCQSRDNKEFMDVTTGVLRNGSRWFDDTLRKLRQAQDLQNRKQGLGGGGRTTTQLRIQHPAKAPMAYSPKDGTTPICRYHNYHPDGCKRFRSLTASCPFDHDHCHACRQAGHVASQCSNTTICY